MGKVVNGKIEVPGEDLAEGTVVTILAPEDRETFRLSPDAEAALLLAIEEADRGQVISGEEVLQESRRPPRPKGTPGKDLLKFFGTIDSEDCRRMKEAIEAACEQNGKAD
jgi:hypothetical protein